MYSICDSLSKLIDSSVGLNSLQLNLVSVFDLDAYFVPDGVSSFDDVVYVLWSFDKSVGSGFVTRWVDFEIVEITSLWVHSLVAKSTNGFVFDLLEREHLSWDDSHTFKKIDLSWRMRETIDDPSSHCAVASTQSFLHEGIDDIIWHEFSSVHAVGYDSAVYWILLNFFSQQFSH